MFFFFSLHVHNFSLYSCYNTIIRRIGGLQMKLKTARQMARISVGKMSLYMHVPRAVINLWESGKMDITDEQKNRYFEIIKNCTQS